MVESVTDPRDLFPRPDWSQHYPNYGQMAKDLDINPLKGWHHKGDDTALVVATMTGGVMVYCWNGRDPRPALLRALSLPEYKYEVNQ